MNCFCKVNVINLYQCDPGFKTGRRVFDYHYFLYVHRGKGWFVVDGVKYEALRGDIFYCPPGKGNVIIADPYDPYLLSGLEFECPDLECLDIKVRLNLKGMEFLVGCINELINEFVFKGGKSQEICDDLAVLLVDNLVRMSMDGIISGEDLSFKLLEYINKNSGRKITHAELAQLFKYHKNSINRSLIKITGKSLKNYLIDLRMRKASELLMYSNKPISEIAELCGYSSAAFFSKQFKEKVGKSPLEFRN